MRSVTKVATFVLALVAVSVTGYTQGLREEMLRQYAKDAGFRRPEEVLPPIDEAQSVAGRLLFESKELSLTREIACKNCHLLKFGSADGLPNAFGTKARGEGVERLRGGGDILPRNTLPLWGRGAIGFDVFFWDGRVDASSGRVLSQFGDHPPSDDPLVVAAHLPLVEIREMIPDRDEFERLRTETIGSAEQVYQEIEQRVRADHSLSAALTKAFDIDADKIEMLHVAQSIAMFYRDHFRIRSSRFHEFVFDNVALSPDELAGGILFYGKARCSTCHNGPFFSDLAFHAIPFSQLGSGKNGFGIDYGRYNVTLNPEDRYKFRTPPLFNVTQTKPYSHSGSIYDLKTAIVAHVDPLAAFDFSNATAVQRVEFYKALRAWSKEPIHEVYLDDDEIAELATFLGTLDFVPDDPNIPE